MRSVSAAAHGVAAAAALAGGDVPAALLHSQTALSVRDELGGLEEDEADLFVVRIAALEARLTGDERADALPSPIQSR